mgnify:CR=1 FL=1
MLVRDGSDAVLAVPLGSVAPGKLTKSRQPDTAQTALVVAAGAETLPAAIVEAVTIKLQTDLISNQQFAL